MKINHHQFRAYFCPVTFTVNMVHDGKVYQFEYDRRSSLIEQAAHYMKWMAVDISRQGEPMAAPLSEPPSFIGNFVMSSSLPIVEDE